MSDSVRSAAVLVASFAAVVAFTVAVGFVLVPRASVAQPPTGEGPGGSASGAASAPAVARVPTQLGGTLVVSGDRSGSFVVARQPEDGRVGAVGDDGRIFFEGSPPLTVAQLNYDGLSFFPEESDCTVTPGGSNMEAGLAWAEVSCEGLSDVRGNGTISLRGTLALPAIALGIRGDLPEAGGTLDAGGEALEFDEAFMVGLGGFGTASGNSYSMLLEADDGSVLLGFNYDDRTHAIALEGIEQDEGVTEVPPEACTITSSELGRLGPQVAIVELSIDCPSVEFPDRGPVPLRGTLIIEQHDV
jgi:hypothetical protein